MWLIKTTKKKLSTRTFQSYKSEGYTYFIRRGQNTHEESQAMKVSKLKQKISKSFYFLTSFI